MGKNFKKIFFFFLLCFFIACPLFSAGPSFSARPLQLLPSDRILILATHPDDEVLACGGIIQQAVAMKLPVHIVFFTHGDSNEWSFLMYQKHPVILPRAVRHMGMVRHDESCVASEILGVPQQQLFFLGYPDYGTLEIWRTHWGEKTPPFRSVLTRVNRVPYPGAFRFGAPYKGEEILQDLTTLVADFHPTKIFVSHPMDHHPDHLALYLFARVALWNLQSIVHSQIYPYLVHYKKWPIPSKEHKNMLLDPPSSLKDAFVWHSFALTPDQVDRKQEALKAHRTQYNSTPAYLSSFVRSNELFGDFPVISLRSDSWMGKTHEMPEHVEDRQSARFIGVEWHTARLEENTLILSLGLSRPLAREIGLSLFVFGYRFDRAFVQMPKIHIKIGVLGCDVYDQNQKLSSHSIRISRNLHEVTVKIPLTLLGNPHKILTSARTILGEIPVDWVPWRIIELPADPFAEELS